MTTDDEVRVYDGRQMADPEEPKCGLCGHPKAWHRGDICGIDCLCPERWAD